MRIAPVGLLHPPSRRRELVSDVALTCDSHYSRTALAAACLIAGAVSAAVEGWGRDEVLAFALKVGEWGETLIPEGPAPAVRYLVLNTVERVRSGTAAPGEAIAGLAATATADDAAALALCLAYFAADARQAILEAANLGGDADTVASMAGGIAAALSPDTLPPEWVVEVERVNNLDLAAVARRLCDLRLRAPSP
ncbi:MAG: ADP-ribosylglycohydrolase family protein [candidate division NC10 bacterium]|nr:ADP-ribosylglycohydrolase family protein [candidate division NC10 bacterium]